MMASLPSNIISFVRSDLPGLATVLYGNVPLCPKNSRNVTVTKDK